MVILLLGVVGLVLCRWKPARDEQTSIGSTTYVPGQIVVNNQNASWLMRDDGRAVFICGPGDPEDFLYRGERLPDGTRVGDQEALINKLISHGGNCIYMQVVRSHGGDGKPDHNPFIDSDPGLGLDEDILDQWAEWFDLMDRHDIVIYLILYDDGADIWKTWFQVGPAERSFISHIVNRYEHFANVIWVVAEEYSEVLTVSRVRAISDVIREEDDHDHPIAVHKLHGLSFEEFADSPYIDQYAIQWNKPTADDLHDGVVTAWKKANGRYNLVMAESKSHLANVNAKNWACAMGGAYVMVLGMDISSTSPELLKRCRILQKFFESSDFQNMHPRDDLAAGASTYVLANPGVSYIVYCSGEAGEIGIKRLRPGDYQLIWIDCENGNRVQNAVEVIDGATTWPKPPGIGEQCAVWITRTHKRDDE